MISRLWVASSPRYVWSFRRSWAAVSILAVFLYSQERRETVDLVLRIPLAAALGILPDWMADSHMLDRRGCTR